MVSRWVRLREHLEGYSEEMEKARMHVDWSDICVLDAYLTDAWQESWMGPEPGKEDAAPTTPKADWSQAEPWVTWWAVSPDGWAMWYEEEPILYQTVTFCGWGAKVEYGIEIGMKAGAGEVEIPLGVDWRLLKDRRPEATP